MSFYSDAASLTIYTRGKPLGLAPGHGLSFIKTVFVQSKTGHLDGSTVWLSDIKMSIMNSSRCKTQCGVENQTKLNSKFFSASLSSASHFVLGFHGFAILYCAVFTREPL